MVLSNTLIWMLCIGTGLLFWLILYFKDITFKDVHPIWRWFMIVLRSLATGILLYLILAPLFKSVLTEIKKPIVVIAQDNSQSLVNNWSKEKQQQYLSDKATLESTLAKTFEILPITFGEKVTEGGSIDFKERATDISAALDYIQNQTAGQNLGAIVLATDGNFNQGRNPLYSNPGLTVPIYTVALGDSTIKRDASIQRILNNSIIYLGDQFEVQVDMKAFQMNHEKANLQLLRIDNGTESILKSEVIDINAGDWYHSHKFILDANKAGAIHYSARINPMTGEYSKENNIKDFFVDVLDARQKILVLAASPHPDLAVFKKILEGNKNYTVDIKQFGESNPQYADYNLVILHQLPSKTIDVSSVIKELNKTQKPRLFVLGSMTDLSKFNSSQTILKIIGDSRNMNEVAGDVKESFSLFTPDPGWKEFFKSYPPISAPFGEYMVSPGTQTLINQKIGNILTNYPLLMIGEDQGIRTAILATEGWWKWRYFNYLEHKNFDVTDDVFKKVIQYIGIKEDKRKFRVNTLQKIYLENQSIVFDGQLFNESYELINTEDASLTITSTDKKDYQFTFNKSGKAYSLDAGVFAPGTYTYTASVNTKAGKQEVKGQFLVQKIQLETYQNTADHNTLRLLSAQQGGIMVNPNQINSLAELINQNKSVKPVQYSSQHTYPIINFKWLFILLAALLCTEWFLRRYHGAY